MERKGEESKKGTFESKFGPQPFLLYLCTLSMSSVSGFNTSVKSLPKTMSILPASPSNSHPVLSFACQSLHWASQGTTDKEPACQCRRQCKRCGFDPWVGKIPWRRAWQSTWSRIALEEGMAIHAWRIPWTEEPGGLWFIRLQSWTQLK